MLVCVNKEIKIFRIQALHKSPKSFSLTYFIEKYNVKEKEKKFLVNKYEALDAC